MKKVIICLALFLYYIIGNGQSPGAITFNWSGFMAEQDMVWNTLPQSWDEGPFLGNGTLGALLYKEPQKNYIHLEVCNSNVHDEYRNKPPRLLIGHFAIHPLGEIENGKMRLNLWDAEATATIKTSKGKIILQAITHADKMGVVIQATIEGDEKVIWEWIPAAGDNPRQLYGRGKNDYKYNPKPVIDSENEYKTSVQPLLNGGQYATAWKITHKNNITRLFINVTHSPTQTTAHKAAIAVVKELEESGWKNLIESHRRWWHNFYPRSFLSLPDKKFENFYWAQMYKLASATRADRALIDNTGPWLTITPWPNAWWNLNVQLTYWPTYTSNHLELSQSLSNTIFKNSDNLIDNIPEKYRYNSSGIGRSSSFDLRSGIGMPGKGKEVGLLTWACHNLWLQYRCSMDKAMLRDQLYPLLKRSINYYMHFLEEDEDGRLHLPSTFSPEYGSAEDCNFDLSLLRWGAKTLLRSSKILHIDNEPLIPEWQKIIEHLVDYPLDKNGYMIGRNQPYVKSHRHYSHLLMIYPLYLVNIEDTPEKRPLIQNSLDSWQSKKDALEGYSYTGASSISSALGNGNDALAYLEGLFTQFLRPNTFYKEAGPVIETPLSGAQSIHDMLLQSWGDKIRIFPAVPDVWQDIIYQNWRAEGAFDVTAKRENGETTFIRIKSLAGEPLKVKTDMKKPQFLGIKKSKITQIKPGLYNIPLRIGEEISIYPKDKSSKFELSSVKIKDKRRNHFGIN